MPGKPFFSVDAIRQLAKDRVEATSLRAVAAEIPMSKSGLDSFLKGRSPYSATQPKLSSWYVRNRGSRKGLVAPEEFEAAIAILGAYVSQDERPEVRQERLRDLIERLRKASTQHTPTKADK